MLDITAVIRVYLNYAGYFSVEQTIMDSNDFDFNQIWYKYKNIIHVNFAIYATVKIHCNNENFQRRLEHSRTLATSI